jgi:hypothetical protein
MGFWDRFKKKPKQPPVETSLPPVDLKSLPQTPIEAAGIENVRAKMDLVLTQLESVNIRMDTFGQRLERLERMVQEIWTIAKRS